MAHDDDNTATGDAVLAACTDALRDLGAADVRHSGTTLLEHLVGTATLLRSWGAEDAVWLAGLLHSVHGTGAYDRELVAPDDRAALRALAGDDALALVDLFERLDRPRLLADARAGRGSAPTFVDRRTGQPLAVTDAQGTALVDLTVANWLELRHRQPEKSSDRSVVAGYHALAGSCSERASAAALAVPLPSRGASLVARAGRDAADLGRRLRRAIVRRARPG